VRRAECRGGGGKAFEAEEGEEEEEGVVVVEEERCGDGSSGVRAAMVVEGGQTKVIGN
jgi:hypothetical protein